MTEKEHLSNLVRIAKAIKASNEFLWNFNTERPTRKFGSATSKEGFDGANTPTHDRLRRVTSRVSHAAH